MLRAVVCALFSGFFIGGLDFPFDFYYDKSKERGLIDMQTENDRKDIQKATIYDLRRLISNGDKETFTKEELCRWLDTIADAKDQE